VETDVNGSSKTSYFEDGTSSSSDEDECYISIGVCIFQTKYKLVKMSFGVIKSGVIKFI